MKARFLKNQKCPNGITEYKQRNVRYEALSKAVKDSILRVRTTGNANAVEEFAGILSNYYTADMFDFGWQYENAIRADAQKIARILSFIMEDATKIVELNKDCECPSEEYGIVIATADMIIKRAEGYAAVFINLGTGERSGRGRTVSTQSMYEPSVVTAKYYLEKLYPGIAIWDMYLNNASDMEGFISPQLDTSDRAEGQFKVSTYKQFYGNDGTFDFERFREEVAKKAFSESGEANCSLCEVADICKKRIPRLEPNYEVIIEQEKAKVYTLPTFTDEQKVIIEKVLGAFLVVAGPGSGKTACLVARICHLVSNVGVPPEFIMAVTFTNKAADEIRNRIADVLGVEINVFTLNGLGYSILRSNAKRLGLEPSKLLTKEIQDAIITALISDRGSGLDGFRFGLRDGKTGYLSTLENRIREFKKEGYPYLEKKGLGEEFVEFVRLYDATVEAGGYITYDEQISKCVALLTEDEDLLDAYRSVCKYMCVDEFQDINSEQWAFISLLAGESGNLMCIGDDDQAIFGFQGGDVRFMLNFKNAYPESETFFLTRNFRSSGNVVSLAAKNLSSDLVRIDKNIVAVKGPGADIGVYEGNVTEQARCVVSDLLGSGVKPEEIAVIASKNATLDAIASNSGLPFAVEGELLVKSAFFTFLRTSLAILKDSTDKMSMYFYFSLFGLDCPSMEEYESKLLKADMNRACVRMCDEDSAYRCLKFLAEARNHSFKEFMYEAAAISGYLGQKVYQQILDEMDARGIRGVDAFADITQRMYASGDTTSLERDYPGRVVCTTVHKAKGREWKYVVVADDFGKKSDATQRAIYVALTRAIDVLYIVKEAGGKSSLVSA